MAESKGLNISTTGRLVTGSFPSSRPDFIGAVAEVTSDTSTGSWDVQSAGRHSGKTNTVSVAELLARNSAARGSDSGQDSQQRSGRSRRSSARQASQDIELQRDGQQLDVEKDGSQKLGTQQGSSPLFATPNDGFQQADSSQDVSSQGETQASIQRPLKATSSQTGKTTAPETSLLADLIPPRVPAEQQPTSRAEEVAPPAAAGMAAAATEAAPAVADSTPAAAEVASNEPDIAALDTAQVIDVEVVTAPSSRGIAEPVDVDFHIFDGTEDDPIAVTVAAEEPAEPALTDLTNLVVASALPQDPAGSLERRRDSVEVVEHWEQPDIAPVPFSTTSEALALLQFDDPESPAYTRPSAQRQLQRMYLSYVVAAISAALSLVACAAGWVAESSWLGFSGQVLLCAAFAAAFSAEWFFRPSKKL